MDFVEILSVETNFEVEDKVVKGCQFFAVAGFGLVPPKQWRLAIFIA
jgi:hypothetical protein